MNDLIFNAGGDHMGSIVHKKANKGHIQREVKQLALIVSPTIAGELTRYINDLDMTQTEWLGTAASKYMCEIEERRSSADGGHDPRQALAIAMQLSDGRGLRRRRCYRTL